MAVAFGNASSTASASNLSKNRSVHPAISATLVATKSPCVWWVGNAWIRISDSLKRHRRFNAAAFAASAEWGSIAPFGRPVVPDV